MRRGKLTLHRTCIYFLCNLFPVLFRSEQTYFEGEVSSKYKISDASACKSERQRYIAHKRLRMGFYPTTCFSPRRLSISLFREIDTLPFNFFPYPQSVSSGF
jgi:hypothetical protein